MAAGFGGRDSEQNRAPISGTRAERYQVVLHVEAATLEAGGDPGRSDLEDGTRVAAETSRRLSCDAGLVRITRGEDGSILDVGRRTRTITPALRRALDVRDRGCRFPGCGLRFTDAHHLRHWADGGTTSLANTVLLCRHHHRLVHEGRWSVAWWGEGSPAFFDPRGGTHFEGRWKPAAIPDDVIEALERENRHRGAEPDWRTASARWKRIEDVPDDVLFAALEAMGERSERSQDHGGARLRYRDRGTRARVAPERRRREGGDGRRGASRHVHRHDPHVFSRDLLARDAARPATRYSQESSRCAPRAGPAPAIIE
jgi:hypothetical protein